MAKRLVRAREQAGYEKAADGARAVGVKEETYWGHENGNRGFKAKAPLYARRFKVGLEWLLTGKGEMAARSSSSPVPIGYIGAGAEIVAVDDHAQGAGVELEPVDLPPGAPEDGALVIVRGDSMHPRYFDNEYLYYMKDERHPSELLNQEAVVKLVDGRIFVKILRRGSDEKHYNLESFNTNTPTMVDEAVEWAAPVWGRVNRRATRR